MKILAPFLSCVVSVPSTSGEDELAQAIAENYGQIYILSPHGMFLHQRLKPGKDGKQRFIRSKVTSIPGMEVPGIEPAIHFLPDGKIPVNLLWEIEDFFRRIIEVKKTAVEAMIWIMWNQERGYFLHVPKQTVSKASATYDWTDLPANSSIIVDIHSHADFSAFFSGTDNRDDQDRIGFSGVIGHNDKDKRSYAWRFNNRSEKTEITVDQLFLQPVRQNTEVPSEWVDKVGSPTYQGYQNNGRTYPYYQPGANGHTQRYMGFMGSEDADPAPGQHPGLGRANSEFPSKRHSFYPAQDESPLGPEFSGTRKDQRRLEKERKKNKNQAGNHAAEVLNRGGSVTHFPDGTIMVSRNGATTAHGSQRTPQGNREMVPGHFSTNDIDDASVEEEYLGMLGFSAQQTHLTDELEKAFTRSPDMHESILADMHARQRQADLVEGVEEEAGASIIHLGMVDDIEVEVSPEGGLRISVPAADIPGDFDVTACNHGKKTAMVVAAIDALTPSLIGTGEPLKNMASDLFALIPDEEKLALFKEMFQLLPDEATAALQTNGF